MKDLKLYISIGFALLIVYCVLQYNRPKPVDWHATYLDGDKIPYGTYLAYKQLNNIFPKANIRSNQQSIYNTLTNDAGESSFRPGSYLIVAPGVAINEIDFKQLVAYMQKGNAVFIASFHLSRYFKDTLKLKINSEPDFLIDQKSKLQFVNPALNPKKIYTFKRQIGNQYFSKLDTARAVVLGKNQLNHANFVRYAFGKGFLYLLPSPDYFINYNMLQVDGNDYAAKALSYLNPTGEIIWDEYAAAGPIGVNDSPMRVFLSHAELRWAYYIALFSLLFFVLYEVKRRQRIIPIADPLRNTTVEFVQVVGQVYYQQRDNLNIANKKVMFLLEHIRSRYQLKTMQFDHEFLQNLVQKSGADKSLISNIFKYIGQVQTGKQLSDKDLIDFNYLTEQFYEQSGQ